MSDSIKLFRMFMTEDASVRGLVYKYWVDSFGSAIPLVGPEKAIAEKVLSFRAAYRVPPSLGDMRTLLQDEEDKEITDLFEQIVKEVPSEENIGFLMDRFVRATEDAELDRILDQAKKIQVSKVKIGKETLEGPKDAAKYVQNKIASMGASFRAGYVGGNIMNEGDDIKREYKFRKDNPELTVGYLTGLDHLDLLTRGLFVKQLWVILGAAGCGKSMMVDNWLLNMSVRQGVSVALGTKEMPKPQRRKRMVCIHSYNEKFHGTGEALLYNQVRDGELGSKEELFFERVVDDLSDKGNGYGSLEIFEAGGMTFDEQRARLEEVDAMCPNGLEVFADDMLYHTVPTPQDKEIGDGNSLSGLFKRAKQMSMNFANRRGICYVTPHHVNRDAQERAEKSEEYQMTDGRMTSEIEQSADVIIWILRLQRYEELNQARVGVAKVRDSGSLAPFFCFEDFKSSFLGNLNADGFMSGEEEVGATLEDIEL